MHKILRPFLLFLALLFVGTPVTAKSVKGQFSPAPPPPSGYALIYMYRVKTQPALRTPTILVDGEKTTTLPNNSYTWFYVTPGSHTLRTKWGFMADVPELEGVIHALPDQTHFVKMQGSVQNWGVGRYKTYTGIAEVSEADALKDLTKSKKYTPALILTVGLTPATDSSEKIAPQNNPVFKEAPPPQPGYGLVYIYRPITPALLMGNPKILIDGKPQLKLTKKSYTALYLKTGDHHISTDWGWLAKNLNDAITLNIMDGSTSYVRLSAIGGGDNYQTNLDSVDQHLANKEFSAIRGYIKPPSEYVE